LARLFQYFFSLSNWNSNHGIQPTPNIFSINSVRV
jgi:hypothetical protein